MQRSSNLLMLFLALVLSACATGPTAYSQVNTISPERAARMAEPVPCEQLSHPDSRDGCRRDRAAAAAQNSLAVEEARRREESLLRRAQAAGPVLGYALVLESRYPDCESLADRYLRATRPPDAGELLLVQTCVQRATDDLDARIRDAIKAAPSDAVDAAIKDLHAYAVASLRSLGDLNQSEVEARRARAERRTGINQRIERLRVELL